jgi:MFS family permease
MADGTAAAEPGAGLPVDAGAAATPARAATTQALLALIGGQVALHSCMAGIRMAAPLAALREGHAAWAVGVLLGLFATAPVALALAAGRLADRHGYHLPIRLAVALTVGGGVCAVVATLLPTGQFGALCAAALLTGAGANVGLIAIQRSAGRMARDPTTLKQIFSWLGLAPALANVVGPVLAGTLIDLGGFRLAFGALAALPFASLAWARLVPVEERAVERSGAGRQSSWNLLRKAGFARLLLVNWLLASSWDVHSFLVPILGHERGFSASAIGLILGVFATAVAAVRLAIPMLAHRLRESRVLIFSMLACAVVFAVYPLARSSWMMGCLAVVLGLALGAVQPMIMTTLHQITPAARHGEAIALRSMAINMSSAVMPLAFGLAGATLGASALFWMMGAAVASGSVAARRIGAPHATLP